MNWRYFPLIFGYIIVAFGVSMMVHVKEVGLEPWVALNVGLSGYAMTIGFWDGLVKIVFILLVIIMEKRFPRIGTWLNLIIISPLIDVFIWLIPYPEMSFLAWKYLFFVVGIALSTFGMSIAIATELGTGPKTQFIVVIESKTGYKLSNVKYVFECSALLVALLIGGPIFIGTLVFVYLSGLFLDLFVPRCRKWLKTGDYKK